MDQITIHNFQMVAKDLFQSDTPFKSKINKDAAFETLEGGRKLRVVAFSGWYEATIWFEAELLSEETFEVTVAQGILEASEDFEMDMPDEEMKVQFQQMLQGAFGDW